MTQPCAVLKFEWFITQILSCFEDKYKGNANKTLKALTDQAVWHVGGLELNLQKIHKKI